MTLPVTYSKTLPPSTESISYTAYGKSHVSASLPNAPLQLQQYTAILDEATKMPKTLGEGGWSSVILYKQGQKLVAIKRIPLTGLPQGAGYALELARLLPRELYIHYGLTHRNIASMQDAFVSPDNHLNIVTDYVEGGTLLNFLNSHQPVTEDMARSLFQQLVLTLDYLHSQSIFHRDVKLDNVLIQPLDSQPVPQLKLVDFGLSMEGRLANTNVGTYEYKAPEVQQVMSTGSVALAPADVWSAGVLLYAMLNMAYPFPSSLPTSQRWQAMHARPLQHRVAISDGCKDLLEQMLHPDPAQRITIEGIKQHPWFLENLTPGMLHSKDMAMRLPSRCVLNREQLDAVIEQVRRILQQEEELQELKQLLQTAQEQDEFVQLQFEDDCPAGHQHAAFTLLDEQGFIKLRTTPQGHVFATSSAIQALYNGVPGSQQQHAATGTSAAAAATGASAGAHQSIWSAFTGLGLFSGATAAQPAVVAGQTGSIKTGPCTASKLSRPDLGVPPAPSVSVSQCKWVEGTVTANLDTTGKTSILRFSARGQHGDALVTLHVHPCMHLEATGTTDRQLCLRFEALRSQVKEVGSGARHLDFDGLPTSNPLGVMWVQVTAAATEGGRPVVFHAQRLDAGSGSDPACAETLQCAHEVTEADPGGWTGESVGIKGVVSIKPSVEVSATAKNRQAAPPPDAKLLDVLQLREEARHLELDPGTVHSPFSFRLLRHMENSARCRLTADMDTAGMLSNNSMSFKGDLRPLQANTKPPPIRLHVGVELMWAAEPVAPPASRFSQHFKRAQTMKPLQLVFSASAAADLVPSLDHANKPMEGTC